MLFPSKSISTSTCVRYNNICTGNDDSVSGDREKKPTVNSISREISVRVVIALFDISRLSIDVCLSPIPYLDSDRIYYIKIVYMRVFFFYPFSFILILLFVKFSQQTGVFFYFNGVLSNNWVFLILYAAVYLFFTPLKYHVLRKHIVICDAFKFLIQSHTIIYGIRRFTGKNPVHSIDHLKNEHTRLQMTRAAATSNNKKNRANPRVTRVVFRFASAFSKMFCPATATDGRRADALVFKWNFQFEILKR